MTKNARQALACLPIFGAGSCAPAALAAALDLQPGALYPLADKLREAALLVFDPHSERYQWHASVGDYARAALPLPDLDAACRRTLEQTCTVFDTLPESADASTRPDLLNDLLNLYLLADWAAEQPEGEALARLATAPRNWWAILSYHTAWRGWLENALRKPITDRRLKANVLQAIGDVQNFRDERDAALESYNEALKLFRAVGARLGEANVLQAIGQMSVVVGLNEKNEESFQKGMEILQEAMTLFEQVRDKVGQTNILMFLSRVAASVGQKEKAIEIAQSAMTLLVEVAGESHPVTLSFEDYIRQLRES
jgi:tetratricopeptide (TPR) repeat protein